MKRTFIILLTVILTLLLVACGTETNEKSELTNDTSIKSSNDDASESSDSTAIQEEIDLAWPKDKLSSSVPKLRSITITSITDIENGVLITFIGCDEDETKKYINSLKKDGWDFETQNTEEGKTVFASKQNESLVFFSPIYDNNIDIGSITYISTE